MSVDLAKKLLALGTLLAFSFLVLFNDYGFAQEETLLNQAQALFSQGNYEEAVNMLDGYIGEIQAKPEQKPNLAAAWYLLAKVYFEVGDDAKCDAALLKVLSALPGFDRDEPNFGFRERVLKAKAQLAGNLPVAAETTEQPVVPQKETETKTIEQQSKVVPQTVEMPKQGVPVVVKKKKKFPWLLAILGVGLVVVLVVLLTKKKKQTLTVNLGAGTTGTPAATANYNKGQVVNYSYTPQAGYGSLLVKLDGVTVAAGGSVTMDKDHILEAYASLEFTLTVHRGTGTTGTPAATTKYRKDEVVPYSYSARAGYGSLLVKLDGVAVAPSGVVAMGKDHTLNVSADQQYTLTVHRGAGTTGTPAATTNYNQGHVVNYSYGTQAGYSSLQVKLDGVTVAANGSVTMDNNHSIATSATQGAIIQVNSTPAGAKIYLNKVDSGQVTPHTFIYPVATTRAILLRHQCGYQEWTQTVTANFGQEIVVNHTFKSGIFEDFEIPASKCWLPRNAPAWSVSAGVLKGVHSASKGYEFNVYNHSFSADYTIIVKQKIDLGKSYSMLSMILSTGNDNTYSQGYGFDFSPDGEYMIYKCNGYNFVKDNGSWSLIKNGASSALNKGNGVWNIIKIIKAGANYSLYFNNKFIFSFMNAGWDPRYISLAIKGKGTKVHYDSVLLTAGSSGESVPGLPVNDVPATTDKLSRDH